jgi:hypothetical protein
MSPAEAGPEGDATWRETMFMSLAQSLHPSDQPHQYGDPEHIPQPGYGERRKARHQK